MEKITHELIRQQGRYSAMTIEGLKPSILLGLYRHMLRLRMVEEALMKEYRVAEEIRCPVHFTLGQEAVPAALSLLLKRKDFLFSHHRCHGYFLAKGAPLDVFFAELFGRSTGVNGGLAGSQEISMPSINFNSGAILTGASSMAAGAAFAFQHRKEKTIAAAGFGEAATEEGVFWEAITWAAAKKLPLVYVCENNLYSMYSPLLKRQPADDIHKRVKAFGVKTWALFGNDVAQCYRTLRSAIRYARSGKGPCYLEFYTYRWNAHVGPEPDDYIGYRSEAEIEFWKGNCPIVMLEEKLMAAALLDEAAKKKMTEEIQEEIAAAFRFARSSPFPTDVNLEELNRSSTSPLAEKLLPPSFHGEFDENQPVARLAPY